LPSRPAYASSTLPVLRFALRYPGGLKAYVHNGRQLLADSKAGVNPLEGWTPEVPVGETLQFATKVYDEAEAEGLANLSDGQCAFVLVSLLVLVLGAGGMGWDGKGRTGEKFSPLAHGLMMMRRRMDW
jgi:hypothetical protein